MEQSKKRHVELKDHIGIYDGYIPDIECDKAIQFFEKQNALNKAYDRLQSENANLNFKNDKAITLNEHIETWFEEFKPLLVNFDMALRHYQDATGVLTSYGIDGFKYTHLKIQKTLPTQGYHVWHLEHGIYYLLERDQLSKSFSVYYLS
jgi:molecular chaperone GrpE (heat shock protein)